VLVDLAAASPDADPFKEETWRACNEALGIFLSLDEFREAADRAQRVPAFEASFLNLRLNMRVDASEEQRLFPAPTWAKLGTPVNVAKLKGKACFGGLDLSGKHDLTALVLVFPDKEGGFDILPYFWTPIGALDARRTSERDLFKEWIRAGHLIGIPGPVIRYRFVAEQLASLRKEFDIRTIGYDRWRIDDFRQELNDVGAADMPMKEFGQGFQSMAPAIDHLEELALTGRLRHGGHPVLTACMLNAVITTDPASNRKFDKERASSRGTIRIDGATALATALGIAKGEKPKEPPKYQVFVL
jgi:phage terminase large subunit-like protein